MKRHASMNRIYRLVWSRVHNALIAVAETARGRGKGSSRKLVAAALSLTAAIAQAAPTGGQVAAGAGSISQSGATTTIQQSSQTLSLNWKSFNIAAQETVNFLQPSASAIAVNRIFDTNGTQILGHLNANGQVWLVNPNGILFGQGAQVNVGGLIASTLDLNDATLNGAARSFSGKGTGSVINQGTINAADGGYVALLGNTVANQGAISARLGAVALGAGSAATLTFSGNSLLKMQVDQSTLNNLAENGGLIRADGGMVVMNAGAKNALLASVVNNTGLIEARTVEQHEGTIVLLGGMTAGQVNVGGTLDASAPSGGKGGFIETSAAHVKIANDAKVTTAASMGLSGTWLIDPVDFTIAATGGDMTGATLSTNLGAGNVSIQSSAGAAGTAGDVNVNDVVAWSANKLTLNAQNNININANLNGSGTASLALEYDQSNSNNGAINVKAPVNLPAGPNFSTKKNSYGSVIDLTVITALGAAGSTTGADLQGISGSLAGKFVLGSNIDAAATAAWNSGAGFVPIGSSTIPFTGTFDGLGHTISNLSINLPTTTNVGLIGYMGVRSAILNVGMIGGSVRGADNVGELVGYATNATVRSSYATGSVSGANQVGGLVGYADLSTVIGSSHATGTVTGTGGSVGGLAGLNHRSSNLINTYATGNVSSTGNNVGGLVGTSDYGSIYSSHATGSVSGIASVGGLVGYIYSGYFNGAQIVNSYATGSVSGAGDSVGGLVGTNIGAVSTSYATGNVNSTGNNVGGLVGYSSNPQGQVNNSYATGNVSGASSVGGLVGYRAGRIDNSYATGIVSGTTKVGGLLGNNNGPTGVGNSYWDTTTSGKTTSIEGAGRNTAQMQQQSNFVSWDFANTWVMYDGFTYPLLRSFMTPLTVTANSAAKTYDGLAYSGGNGVTYSSTPNANLLGVPSYGGTSQGATSAGSFAITPGGVYSTLQQGGYAINFVDGTLTVNPAVLSVTGATAGNKVYDGGTAATLTGGTLVGVIGADVVTFTQGTFASKDVGASIAVAASIGGAAAGNYTLTQPSGLAADITPANLSVTGTTAANKVYDGSSAATLSAGVLNGVVAGDTVTLTQAGAFASKNVATGIAVTAADSIGGTSAGNYTLTQPAGLTANITPANLSVTGTSASNKVYDGTTVATLTGGSLAGVIGADVVTLTEAGSFASKNVATGIAVTAANNLGGAGAGNYALTQPTGLTATITPANLSVTGASASNKVYDGSTAATLSGGTLAGVIGSDALSVTQGVFASKNVASGIAVAASLGGAEAGNYTLTQPTGLAADITAATLSAAIIGTPSKVYNGTTAATLTPANYNVSGFVAGEGAAVGQVAGTYNSPNVLAASSVSATLVSTNFSANAGTLLSNYLLPTSASGAGSITPAGISASANAATRMANRLVFSGTPGGAANAGSYVLTPGGLYASLYNIGYANNTLTLLPSATSIGLSGGVYETWYGMWRSYLPRMLAGM